MLRSDVKREKRNTTQLEKRLACSSYYAICMSENARKRSRLVSIISEKSCNRA